MKEKRRLLLLIIVMMTVAVGGTAISMTLLYLAAFEEERSRLVETAQSQARLIEAVARFDSQHSADDVAGGAFEATLSQIREAHSQFKGFGESGEFTLARRDGDQISFLLSHRYDDLSNPQPVPFSSELAEPMRRALMGGSGTVVGLDYRGAMVLAAYEPVVELDLGIVAKIDLAEIRAPFFKAGVVAGLAALGLTLVGVMVFARIGNPMIRRLETHAAELRGEVEERKRVEEGLRESERLLNQAQQIAHVGSYSRDIESGKVVWSGEQYRIFGYQPGEINPTLEFVCDHIHQDDLQGFLDANQALTARKQPYDCEYRIVRKDGQVRTVRSMSSLDFDSSGRPKCQVGALQDITGRKQAEKRRISLERQVQHSQKLESLGVLAGGIAHDFNNLLTIILGNADLAMDQLLPHSPARENLREIEKTSRLAAELARQMLAYSGRGRFVIEPIDLNDTLREMGQLLDVSISKRVVIKYDLAQNLPVFDGDLTQIRQVIMNLITNASEAVGEIDGVIDLSTGARHCDGGYLGDGDEASRTAACEPLSEGVYTYVEVADTGCGMEAETIKKIFDPFFTTKFTGRGLGMSAVLGIVRGHKGALKISSEVEKGTTIRVLFPANEDP